MKRTRKGFTLVELMIVIGIIGILGAMGMISGQGATSAAKAATILENLNQASGAMMTYYQLNMEAIDKDGVTTVKTGETVTTTAAKKIADGASIYLKGTLNDGDADTLTGGAYYVKTVGEGANQQWWVLYAFVEDSTGDDKVKEVLASKGGLIGTVPTEATGDGTAFNKDSSTYVAMKVR